MTKIPGIFERPKNGSGIWWCRYADGDGKIHREKAHDGRKKTAINLRRDRLQEVKAGRYIPPRAGARLTFRDLAQAALDEKKLHLAESTCETYAGLREQLLPLIGNVPIHQVKAQRITETLAIFKRKGLKGSTVNRFHSLISGILSFGERAGKLPLNEASKVRRFKEEDARVRWLGMTPGERERLEDAFVADMHLWEYQLALNTGLRRGEQFFLEWKNIDIERGNVTVIRGKTGRRHLQVNKAACEVLRKIHGVTGKGKYVSPDARDGMKRDSRTWFETAVKNAGVEDFRWHDLRHTFASLQLMGGASILDVSKMLGHANIEMTMKYAHLAQSHMREAVEKMNAIEEVR